MVSTLECIGSRSPCGKNLLSVSGDLPEEEVAIFFFFPVVDCAVGAGPLLTLCPILQCVSRVVHLFDT